MTSQDAKYPNRTPEGVTADRDGLKYRHRAVFHNIEVDFDYYHGEGVVLPSTIDDFVTSIAHIERCCQDLLSRFEMPEWKPGSNHPADAIDNEAHPARIAVKILEEIGRLRQLRNRRECGHPGVRCRRTMSNEELKNSYMERMEALRRRVRPPDEVPGSANEQGQARAPLSEEHAPDGSASRIRLCECPRDENVSDLAAKIGYMFGKLETALDLEREFMVGERVVDGVRKGAEIRRERSGVPPQEERVRIWREALKAGPEAERAKRNRVARVARELAERFGTSEEAERKFYYRYVHGSGKRDDA